MGPRKYLLEKGKKKFLSFYFFKRKKKDPKRKKQLKQTICVKKNSSNEFRVIWTILRKIAHFWRAIFIQSIKKRNYSITNFG